MSNYFLFNKNKKRRRVVIGNDRIDKEIYVCKNIFNTLFMRRKREKV